MSYSNSPINTTEMDESFFTELDTIFNSIHTVSKSIANPPKTNTETLKNSYREVTNKAVSCGCKNVLSQTYDNEGNVIFAACDTTGNGVNDVDVHYEYNDGKLKRSERIIKVNGNPTQKIIVHYGDHHNVLNIVREHIS